MKMKLCSLILSCILLLTLAVPAFAAIDTSDLDKEISALQPEVNKLQKELDAISKDVNSLTGSIISTKPFIIQGTGVGEQCSVALLSGIKYFVINNPEDGDSSTELLYKGVHKYVGTTTITIGKQKYTAYVFDKFNDAEKLLAVGKELEKKKARLDDLKLQKESLSQDLSFFVRDINSTNELIMQVGNSNMRTPLGRISPIDPSSKDACPVIVKGSTMVPIKAVVEPFGGQVTWNNSSKKATLSLDSNNIELTVNSATALVNGNSIKMPVPAQIINSKVMVPVRFVSENLGMEVEWLNLSRVIRITYDSTKAFINDFEKYLTANADSYSFYDRVIGCTFTYPKLWGKPTLKAKERDNNTGHVTPYTISYSGNLNDPSIDANVSKHFSYYVEVSEIPEKNDTFMDVTAFNNMYQENCTVLPLTESNKGIQEILIEQVLPIYVDNDGVTHSDSNGSALILCTSGKVIEFSWGVSCKYLDLSQQYSSAINSNFKSLTSEIMNILNTLSADEATKDTHTDSANNIFNDDVMSASFTYHKDWGKPSVDDFTYKYHLVTFETSDIHVEVRYENELDKEWLQNDIRAGEKVPLSSTNSGVKEIFKEKNGPGDGEWIYILCKNGSVVTINWQVKAYIVEGSVVSSKQPIYDKTKKQILDMVNSFKISEAMG